MKLLLSVILLLSISLHAQSTYTQEIEQWHAQRIESLKAPDGWLNLVGLYWLEEGRSSFGSSPDNKIVFPTGSIAAKAGYFERKGNTITLNAADNTITIDNQPVKESTIYDAGAKRPPLVSSGSLRWNIIQREDKIGIRLRDLNSPMVKTFKDIDRYPVDTAWRITAIFQPAVNPGSIAITNILGQTNDQPSPGKLIFTLHGQQYSLDPLSEGKEFFIVFGDATNEVTTYPSGRFLSVEKPTGPDNTTTIDFNKAYNPPCAFTDFATCPLPPKQNILPIAIEAGEKNYGHHHKN